MLRATKIRQYVAAMAGRGYRAEDVLAGTGIALAELSDPGCRVNLEQCHAVVANIVALTGNTAIGMDIGADSHLTDLGIVGYALASSRTLRQAVELWIQYCNSAAGLPMRLTLVESPGDGPWAIEASAPQLPRPLLGFYFEESLSMGLSFGPAWTGGPFVLRELRLSYPAPPHAEAYRDRFRCPVAFDSPHTRAVFASPGLSAPFKGNDDMLNELCLRYCARVIRDVARLGPVSSRLRSILLKGRGAVPSLDGAAAALDMSPRSLRRHLQGEGTSFQRLVDRFRQDLAEEYLATGLMPCKEIAHLLGFRHVDAFRRAFRGWTGVNLREYRARSGPLPAPAAVPPQRCPSVHRSLSRKEAHA